MIKKQILLLLSILLNFSIFAGELPGFSGLNFKSSIEDAEKFIKEKQGYITNRINSNDYWEKYNEKVKDFNTDLAVNKDKYKWDKNKRNLTPKKAHVITNIEKKEYILEGKINYAGCNWEFKMKFYDDMFYCVTLTISDSNNDPKFINTMKDIAAKIPLIISKYELTILENGTHHDTPELRGSKFSNDSIVYKTRDDKCSFFDATFSSQNMMLYTYREVSFDFYSYFEEVGKALGKNYDIQNIYSDL